MPFTVQHSTYLPSFPVPQHLDHKPFYALPYESLDGKYSRNNSTDARFISIGLAQYDPNEVSVKVMRHEGNRWSRQAEELPIHRSVDLTIFIAKTLFDNISQSVTIQADTYIEQQSNIKITVEPRSHNEQQKYDNWIQNNNMDIKDRLNSLRKILNELKEDGKI